MKQGVLAALVGAALLAGGSAEAAVQLDPIVVTATRTEMVMSEAPANVAVVTAQQIEQRNYTDVMTALRDVPGVEIREYGNGVGYEGASSLYINGAKEVVWMVDGVRMNTRGTNLALSNLRDMSNIERIEVVKSVTGSLYGSDAKGGVINIITKKPQDGLQGNAGFMAGNFGRQQYTVGASAKDGKNGLRIQYTKDKKGDFKDGDGLTIPSKLDGDTLGLTFTHELNDENDLQLSLDKYSADVMYADDNTKLASRRYGKIDTQSARLIWTYKGEKWDNHFSMAWNKYKTNYNNWPTNVRTKLISDQLTWRPNDSHRVIFGASHQKDTIVSSGNAVIKNSAYFIQDEWTFAPQWMLTAGVRYDDYDPFGSKNTPHVSLMYKVDDGMDIYASWGKFFVVPTTYQYNTNLNKKLPLEPESGHATEFGVNWQPNDTTVVNAHVYKRSTTNKIGWVPTPTEANKWDGHYKNYDEEKAKGVDISVRKVLSDTLSGQIGYVYTDVEATPSRTRNIDGYIPRHAVTASLTYAQERFDATLGVRGVINRPGPSADDVIHPFFPKNTYWITNLSANWHITDDVTVYGQVDNLFDVMYAEQSDARKNWGGTAGAWWLQPGRSMQVGVNVRF